MTSWGQLIPLGLVTDTTCTKYCHNIDLWTFCLFWSKQSACAALRRCCETKCPLFWGLFFFLSFLFFPSPPHTFLPEGVVLGLWNFAQSFKSPPPLLCAWGFPEQSTIATKWIKLENTHLPSPLRHVRRKISASVDGGPSRGSRVRRPGSDDPHRR